MQGSPALTMSLLWTMIGNEKLIEIRRGDCYGKGQKISGSHYFNGRRFCTMVYRCCQKSKKIDVCNKINVISIWDIDDLKIFGNGCKNVIINPNFPNGNITAPNGVKIHHPNDYGEYGYLICKILGH